MQLALNSRPRVLLLCQSAQLAAAEDLKLVIPGINRMNHDEQLQCHEIYSISSLLGRYCSLNPRIRGTYTMGVIFGHFHPPVNLNCIGLFFDEFIKVDHMVLF